MTDGFPEAIAPGASSQLAALLATFAGPLLLLLALTVGLRWWRRRQGAPLEAPRSGDPGPTAVEPARRLLGVMLLLAMVLPTAAAVRQLWPHPDLGWRLAVTWLAVLLVPALAWFAAHARRPGS